MSLTQEEIRRYARHLKLPDFGIAAQEKLKQAKVLVVGTGGLGAPLLQYLTAAGIGTIGVVDFDLIDESNLQRQVLFNAKDVGQLKTTTAIEQLKKQNPHVRFVAHSLKLDAKNAMQIMEAYDLVADGSDNFPTRYLVNDACVLLGLPLIYGSIHQYEGQVSVFNYQNGPNYRDLFPSPPPPEMTPNCAEGGVLGVLPGIIGSMQASEVIKVITGIGNPLSGRLYLFDALEFSSRVLNIRKDPANPISGENRSITELIDYYAFCGYYQTDTMQTIDVNELKAMKEKGDAFTLIDVREEYEYESANIEGINIPMGEIQENLDKVPKEGAVIIHCKSGRRSTNVIKLLEQRHGYQNLTNLEGGILAWKEEIDSDMEVL